MSCVLVHSCGRGLISLRNVSLIPYLFYDLHPLILFRIPPASQRALLCTVMVKPFVATRRSEADDLPNKHLPPTYPLCTQHIPSTYMQSWYPITALPPTDTHTHHPSIPHQPRRASAGSARERRGRTQSAERRGVGPLRIACCVKCGFVRVHVHTLFMDGWIVERMDSISIKLPVWLKDLWAE
jgi:hypothetical protein